MLRKSLAIAVSWLALIAIPVAAQNPAGLEELPSEAVPAPLPPPDYVEHDEELEPEITIVQRKDATVEEYRVNGRLYMVKITPFVGKPYYFVDRNGDGLMDSKMTDAYDALKVPQWVIFSW
ncbi:MAG: hypothetical protein ACI915_003125 [Gammaproteobacteria bacterium]|jgi:hypothetical protein